jgi:hypothetical protein
MPTEAESPSIRVEKPEEVLTALDPTVLTTPDGIEIKARALEMIPLSLIKPYWRNPRKNDAAVEPVKQSILKYGFTNPLLVDAEHIIIAGHTRYRALLALGAKTVPCFILDDLDPVKAKEYRLVDNASSDLAGWNLPWLVPELREVNFTDLQPFFPALNFDTLLTQEGGVTTHPSEAALLALQDHRDGMMARASDRAQREYVEMTCPHCAQTFHVDRSHITGGISRTDTHGDGIPPGPIVPMPT